MACSSNCQLKYRIMVTFVFAAVTMLGFSSYIVFCDTYATNAILAINANETVASGVIVNNTLQLYSSLTEFLQETAHSYNTTLSNDTTFL